ncbi:ATP-binding protein [Streptomyces sp. SID625]|nr:ATP-binding protein [Streptomyces sp. SID625]
MPDTSTRRCGHRCVLPFEAAPAQVRLLRKAAAAQLDQWGMSGISDEAELVVTELATNVIKHVGAGTSATLILERRHDGLRVEVHDRNRARPVLRGTQCEAECGRGLHLLAALTTAWGSDATPAGKAVWCEIELGSEEMSCHVRRAAGALENYDGFKGVQVEGRLREAVMEQSAIGLIADLLHWMSARGLDPDDVLDRAQMHYEAEVDAA